MQQHPTPCPILATFSCRKGGSPKTLASRSGAPPNARYPLGRNRFVIHPLSPSKSVEDSLARGNQLRAPSLRLFPVARMGAHKRRLPAPRKSLRNPSSVAVEIRGGLSGEREPTPCPILATFSCRKGGSPQTLITHSEEPATPHKTTPAAPLQLCLPQR
jgi:hypothetical protein